MSPPFRLFGARNALGVWPSFLTPTFVRSGGDNQLYVQVIDNLDRIADFSTADGPEHSAYAQDETRVDIGDTAVHAFGMSPGEIFTGQRETMVQDLSALVDDPRLYSRPLVRLSLIEFTHQEGRLRESIQEVMHLLGAGSAFSAEHWRDATFLTRRARVAVAAELRMAGKPLSWFPELEAVFVRSRDGGAVLELPDELRERLSANDRDLARFRKHMSGYLKAAKLDDALRIVESAKTSVGTIESSTQKDLKRATRARWLLRGFGRRAAAALRSRELSSRLDIFPVEEMSPVLPRLLQSDMEAVGREWVYLTDMDESSVAAAVEAARAHNTPRSPHLICVHEPDTTSRVPMAFEDWYGIFADTTLILRPKLSSTDSTAPPSRARLVRALLDTRAALQDQDIDHSWPAWAIFSLGASKLGVKDAAEAYRRALIASQNLSLQPDGENSAAVVMSLANPFPEAAEQIYDLARRMSHNRDGLRIGWRKIAYSRYSVPVQVGLLQTAQTTEPEDPNVLVRRVEDTLHASGVAFQRRDAPFGAIFHVDGAHGRFDISVAEDSHSPPQMSTAARIRVVTPESRVHSRWTPTNDDIPSILFGELPLILQSKEPLVVADYLYRLSHQGERLRAVFAEPLSRLLHEELLGHPERYALFAPLQELSRFTSIESVDFEFRELTRRSGFRLDVRGLLTLHVKLDYGDKEDGPTDDKYPGTFVASFEPGSAILLSATVDTTSFYQ